MTDSAIIAGSLVDAKNVNTHKVMRLIIDVPAENALKVIAAFGWPTMVNPVSVAVARLNENTELRNLPTPSGDSGSDQGKQAGTADDRYSRGRHGPHPSITPRSDQSVGVPAGARKSRAQVFGYLCTTVPFQKFLKEQFSDQWHSHIAQVAEDGADDWGAESAARTVRQLCAVTSRSKITKDNAEASALLLAWQLWTNHPELEDA